MSITDNLTPRERQIRETMAGLRGGAPMAEEVEQRAERRELTEAERSRRLASAERELTQVWWCPGCKAENRGSGDLCTSCGRDWSHAR